MNSSTQLITLYHTTNRQTAEDILKHGVGMCADDYEALYERVTDYLNVPVSFMQPKRMTDNSKMLHSGAAWWSCIDRARKARDFHLGDVSRHSYVEGLVRRAAQYFGRPYSEFREIVENITGANTEPVVVVAKLPYADVATFGIRGGCYDYFTDRKHSSDHVVEVLSIQ